jgi:hypothetical protein
VLPPRAGAPVGAYPQLFLRTAPRRAARMIQEGAPVNREGGSKRAGPCGREREA